MKRIKATLLLVLVTFCLSVIAFGGDWDNTEPAVVLNGKLYTIETGGMLYVTELPSGVWKQLGKADFANTKFLFVSTTNLITIEADGSMYSVDPASGAWRKVGKGADWKNTVVGATIGDKLYTVETEGRMFETNTTNGVWRQIGKTDYLRTKYLYSDGTKLYSIEHDGYFYSINASSGVWQKISNSNDWLNTNRSVMFNGKLYTTENNNLFVTDPATGVWKQLGKREFSSVDHLVGAGDSLYSIEFNGQLFRVNPTDGSRTQIGK
ncbi:MAG TPA: hypothetical protein PKA82_02980 [Pyrinomonadaceae bacterium]|mgnify:CR=1 FL=1|nr:hypothetical protein [Pyrinomonadaceae bacterium]